MIPEFHIGHLYISESRKSVVICTEPFESEAEHFRGTVLYDTMGRTGGTVTARKTAYTPFKGVLVFHDSAPMHPTGSFGQYDV